MYHTSFLFALVTLIALTTSWQLSPITLPRMNSYIAVGYYNGIIYLLGGKQFKQQLLQYNIQEDILIENGSDALPINTFGESKYYTQIDNYLYLIDESGKQFSRYDLKTNIFENNWENIEIEIDVDRNGCLTSNGNYLFIAGGTGNGITSFQILEIGALAWLLSPPSMNEARGYHSCIIHSNTNRLYVIGGYSNDDPHQPYLDTLEYIYIGDMSNILNENWIILTDKLVKKSSECAAVEYKQYVYIIGGYNRPENIDYIHNEVQILDTRNNSITIQSYLNYSTVCAGSVIINGIIYTFAGYGWDGNGLDTWQYYAIPTSQPTSQPTIQPTSQQPTTSLPTIQPIEVPTLNPSTQPTVIPSAQPTSLPTSAPTFNPSAQPTVVPSIKPTFIPSINPTNNPTLYPTISPFITAFPTAELIITADPTYQPTITYTTDSEIHIVSHSESSENNKETEITEYMWISIGSTLLICICCGLLMLFWFLKFTKKTKAELTKIMALSVISQSNDIDIDIYRKKKKKKKKRKKKNLKNKEEINMDIFDNNDNDEGKGDNFDFNETTPGFGLGLPPFFDNIINVNNYNDVAKITRGATSDDCIGVIVDDINNDMNNMVVTAGGPMIENR